MAPYADSLQPAGVALQLPPEIYHPSGPSQCHDITVYPAAGLAGGACSGYGLLLEHQGPRAPGAARGGVRLELRVLAFGDIQQ